MKVLIEGYSYDPAVVKNILPESRFLLTDRKAKIENVGYYRNPECDDFVFFLPKVQRELRRYPSGTASLSHSWKRTESFTCLRAR